MEHLEDRRKAIARLVAQLRGPLTQEELAQRMGNISREAISQWERGIRRPSRESVERLVRASTCPATLKTLLLTSIHFMDTEGDQATLPQVLERLDTVTKIQQALIEEVEALKGLIKSRLSEKIKPF